MLHRWALRRKKLHGCASYLSRVCMEKEGRQQLRKCLSASAWCGGLDQGVGDLGLIPGSALSYYVN